MGRLFLVVASLCTLACGEPAGSDAGPSDAGSEDAAMLDASLSDAGTLDASLSDAGSLDASPSDAGSLDASPLDASLRDAGIDAALSDSGVDAGASPTCVSGEACGDGAWCRPSEAGPSSCTPYVGDGASCGGNGPPWTEERCHPSVDCVLRDPSLTDAPGVCAVVATAAELDATPSTYDGRWVAVLEGWVRMGAVGCSSSGCGDGCCDVCVSDLYLHDAAAGPGPRIALITPAGIGYDCRGDECALEATCDAAPDTRHRVIGPFEESSFQEHRLAAEHLLPLP